MLSMNLVFKKRATILLDIFLATDWMAAASQKLVLDTIFPGNSGMTGSSMTMRIAVELW
jgi:hypothetical protein